MKKIKVLEVVDSVQYGGVEQLLYNYLSNLDLKEFDLTIVTMGKRYYEAEKKFTDLGIKIIGITARRDNIIKYVKELNRIIKNGKFDVIHAHADYWSFIPLFLGKIYNVHKRIAHSHCTLPNSIKISILSKLTTRYSNVRLSCSKEAGESIYGNKTFYILKNAIDIDRFKYDKNIRQKVRNRYNINSETIVIGQVGRLCSVKNQSFTIEIFNNYLTKNNNARLLLIGDGPDYEEIVKKINNLEIGDKVIFLDNVDNINELYHAMDVFVFPSLYEGFGMAALEAQYSGLKCIVSTGVPKEIKITDNVNFISLDNVKEWNEAIEKICINYNRNIEIENKDYDIKEATLKLKKIYLNDLNSINKSNGGVYNE